MTPIRILLVESDASDASMLAAAFARRPEPVALDTVATLGAAREALGAASFDLVALDARVTHSTDGVRAVDLAAPCPVVMFGPRSAGEGAEAGEPVGVGADADGIVARALAEWRDGVEVRDRYDRLTHSERHFRTLVENSLDVVAVLGPDGRFRYHNQAVRAVLGYEPEELDGRDPMEMVHPDDREAVAQMILSGFSGSGEGQLHRMRVRHKDGSWRYMESFGRVVRDEQGEPFGIVSSRDVTERRAAEEHAREMTRILEASFSEIYIIDTESLGLLQVNERAQQNLGYRSEELARLTAVEILPELTRDLLTDLLRAPPDAAAPVRVVGAHRRKDGSTYPVEAQVHRSTFEGWPAFVLMAVDISEREKALAAERDAEAKAALLANMNHELRTPLNAILGFARVLMKQRFGELNQQQVSFVRDIVHGAEHMLSLVDDLLDLRRLEEDPQAVEHQPVDVAAVVDEALRQLRPLAEQRQVEIATELGEVPKRPVTDRRALVKILTNLVSNAIKYTPASGRVAVRVAATGDALRLEVADTGVGISPEQLPHLFTFWHQIGGKHTYGMRGSGIGLALTSGLASRIGARIDVASTLGEGTQFVVILPIDSPANENKVNA